MNTNNKIFNIFQGAGVGHLYPKFAPGDVETRRQVPYWKTAEEFDVWVNKERTPDVQCVPFDHVTMIDIDLGKYDRRAEVEAWLDAHPIWSGTLWYQTTNGRHYYFILNRDNVIGNRHHLTRCITLEKFPDLITIDVPWNGKCPPTKGRSFKALHPAWQIAGLEELGATTTARASQNVEQIFPVEEKTELSRAEAKDLEQQIDTIKRHYPTAIDEYDGREKILPGNYHDAFLRLANVLAWAGLSMDAAWAEFVRFNRTSIMTPENEVSFRDEWERLFLDARGHVERERVERIRSIQDILDKYVYVLPDDLFINTKTSDMLKPVSFNNLLAPHMADVNPARRLFQVEAIQVVDQVVKAAGEAMYFTDPDGREVYNTWKRPSIDGPVATPVHFLSHLDYLFPDIPQVEQGGIAPPLSGKSYKEIVLDYMAHIVQNPGKNHGFALLIHGDDEGTGKSYLIDIMEAILGKANTHKIGNSQLTDRDTSWMEHELVYINDIDQADKHNFIELLKDSITDKFISIRKLYRSPYNAKNVMNIIATTNHDDAIYFHNPRDRRWAVVHTKVTRKPDAYYSELHAHFAEELPGVVDMLMGRDLSHYAPKGLPPMTEIKQRMIMSSMTEMDEDLAGALESIEFNLVVRTQDVLDMSVYRGKGPRAVSRAMKKHGYTIAGKYNIGGKKTALFVKNSVKPDEIDHYVQEYRRKMQEGDALGLN